MNNEMNNKTNDELNLAYKCILLPDIGLILIFNKIQSFQDNDIKVKIYQGEVFIGFGKNIALLPKTIITELLNSPKIYLCTSDFSNYLGISENYYIEVDEKFIAMLEGALRMFESLSASKEQPELLKSINTNA